MDARQRMTVSALLNATSKTASGVVVTNGTAAPSFYDSGLPYESDSSLAIDNTTAISTYHQGLPFTANGRLVTSTAAVTE